MRKRFVLALACALWAGAAAGQPFPAQAGQAFHQAVGLGLAPPVEAAASELYEKQFITHWLFHRPALAADINEDLVGEPPTGRCSMLKLTDAPQAPEMYATYSNLPKLRVDASYAPGDNTDLTNYWVTWVKSPSAQAVQAWLGASDYFKLWINGTLVGSRTSGGPKPYTEDEYKLPASLQAGWNLIVFKQGYPKLGPAGDPDPNNLYKYFSLRFVRADTLAPVTNLVASFDPDPSCDDRAPLRTATPGVATFSTCATGATAPTWRWCLGPTRAPSTAWS